MTVPIPVIAGVGLVILIVIVIVIFKILCKRKPNSSSKKGDCDKLEIGELNRKATLDENRKRKKKKKKKREKRRSKGKSKRNGSEDVEAFTEKVGEYDSSSMRTEDLAVPLLSRLQFSVSYMLSTRQIFLTIHRGENLGVSSTSIFEVRGTILPAKKQKLRTKCQSSGNPVFNEMLVFDEVLPKDLELGTLRLRVYRLNGRQRRLVGEVRTDLKADLRLDTNDVKHIWREITLTADIADDISDTIYLTDPESVLATPTEKVPMLLISLQYKTVTGILTVEVVKARQLRTPIVQKAPETFVEISLLNSNGREISSANTGVCKGSYHPVFEETFQFSAIKFVLDGLTLVFSVYCRKFRKKELIGWLSVGRQSTGEREQLHWDEMIRAYGEPIRGWHVLIRD